MSDILRILPFFRGKKGEAAGVKYRKKTEKDRTEKGKTRKICLRITEEEYQKLLEDTRAAGIPRDNVSEYLRRQLRLFRPEDLSESEHWKELAYQIRKIGINVNQIVSRHNSRLYFPSDKEQLKRDLEEIKMLLCQGKEEGKEYGGNKVTSHETGETIREQSPPERDCLHPE